MCNVNFSYHNAWYICRHMVVELKCQFSDFRQFNECTVKCAVCVYQQCFRDSLHCY
jgi:hypothetical protein